MHQSKPAVLREILADEKGGGTSRTRDAIVSGSLKFVDCDFCAGVGKVPG